MSHKSNSSRLCSLLIIALLSTGLFAAAFLTNEALGYPYWLSGWSYRKSHVVGSAAGAGTGYQTMVQVTYTNSSSSSWLEVLPTNIPLFMTTDVSSNGTVFAGDNNYQVYRSTDSGLTFSNIFSIPVQSDPWGVHAGKVWTVFVDSRDYLLISAGSTNRIYRSTNGGVSFVEVLNLPGRSANDGMIISMTEDASGNLYAAEYANVPPARLWKSTDGGATWSSLRSWDARHLHAVKFNSYNGWLYVVIGEDVSGTTEHQTVWRSKDGGNNWQLIVARGSGTDTKYLPIEFIGNDVYLGQDRNGPSDTDDIHRITDDGVSEPFSPVTVYDNPYLAAIMTFATKLNDTIIFTTSSEGYTATCQVVMSNNGVNWTVLNAQDVSPSYRWINELTIHPRKGIVYGCINMNYCYYIASPSTPRPPSLHPPLNTVSMEGHCKTDFGDVRFTDDDGATLLDYWMETKVDGESATFWVEVSDDLSSVNRTIYMYYGKSDATTTSNADNTFVFFDGFSGDLSKWTNVSGTGTWTIESGNLVIQPEALTENDYLVTASALGVNGLAIRTRMQSTQIPPPSGSPQAHPGVIWHANTLTGTNHRNDQLYFRPHDTAPSSSQGNIQPASYSGTVNFHDGKPGSYYIWNTWNTVEVRIPPSGNLTLYGNDVSWHNWNNQSYSYDHIGLMAHGGGKDYFDYFAVRKFVDPEPAHGIWGNEETASYARIYVDLPTIQKGPGDIYTTFQTNIMIANVTDLRGFEFNLTWDNSLVTLVQIDFNTTLDAVWGHDNWFLACNLTQTGFYELAAVSTATGFTTTEAASLAMLEFRVEDPYSNFEKNTTIHFAAHKLSDSKWKPIVHTAQDASYRITGEMAALLMSPSSVTCRKFGEIFTVALNVSKAANVSGFEFEAHYNATLLDIAGITWNAFGTGTYATDEINGILVGYTSGSSVSGNLTLMTVTFNATYNHMWKDESQVLGWRNNQTGTIFIQKANLSYPSSPDARYERGGMNQIDVGPDFAYTFSPIQGDVDNDGKVSVFDLRTMAAYYNAEQGDPNWSQASKYDLNGDDTIDIFDLVVVGSNFGYIYTP